MKIAIAACFAAAIVFLSATAGEAHEIGTTRVSVVLGENASYEVEIVTDATALIEKLDVASGRPPVTHPDNALLGLLQQYGEIFRRRVTLAFDGIPVNPSIEYAISGTTTATECAGAVIKLRGEVPGGARRLEWNYSWTFATYALSVQSGNSEPATQWLEGGQTSAPIFLTEAKRRQSRASIALQYLKLGFTHIVPEGLDHMLFVFGIFLMSRRLREILAQISAFTIAHSITLALSVYGVISVSSKIVEPLIAISIAYVAIENIFMSELKPWRVALVFAFGLMHGMGFAGALKELGLPRSQFVTALVTFNIGVEAGQLAVIGAAFLLVGWYCGRRDWYRRVVVVPASVLIACTAVYWTVERL